MIQHDAYNGSVNGVKLQKRKPLMLFSRKHIVSLKMFFCVTNRRLHRTLNMTGRGSREKRNLQITNLYLAVVNATKNRTPKNNKIWNSFGHGSI